MNSSIISTFLILFLAINLCESASIPDEIDPAFTNVSSAINRPIINTNCNGIMIDMKNELENYKFTINTELGKLKDVVQKKDVELQMLQESEQKIKEELERKEISIQVYLENLDKKEAEIRKLKDQIQKTKKTMERKDLDIKELQVKFQDMKRVAERKEIEIGKRKDDTINKENVIKEELEKIRIVLDKKEAEIRELKLIDQLKVSEIQNLKRYAYDIERRCGILNFRI